MERRSWLADSALAVALTAFGVIGTLGAAQEMSGARMLDAAGMALVVATTLVLAVRRRFPVTTLAVATAFSTGYLLAGYPYGPILVAFFVAVYSVAAHVGLTRAVTAAGVALLATVSHVVDGSPLGWYGLVPAAAWVVVPFAAGVTVRVLRDARRRDRAETIRQHVSDERLRVAQEVHDVVGHGLVAIKMQADVALHLLDRKPEQAHTALRTISSTSTAALDELRATLTTVRRGDAREDRTPAPGLARIDELAGRMREAGLDVAVRVTGTARPVTAAVDLACYRVVQESLTNVLRHSGARVASVGIDYDTDAVVITATNPAGAASPEGDGAGLGVAGMRERVSALGGTFRATPTTDGGFEVRASLPSQEDMP
ncbi:MAG: sensor histidine kinase [Actinophytocola sp.]|nr:sensor histidine kinase [Actinophytocola sp.]